MREEVERFGGTVAQLTGDGILALFGAPIAHEDDSERAVRAALAIREALDAYAAEVAPAYGLELRARIAVNTGPVVVPATRRRTSSTTRSATPSTWPRACKRLAMSSWDRRPRTRSTSCSSSTN
jgi:class 3 adenylate cyclase